MGERLSLSILQAEVWAKELLAYSSGANANLASTEQ